MFSDPGLQAATNNYAFTIFVKECGAVYFTCEKNCVADDRPKFANRFDNQWWASQGFQSNFLIKVAVTFLEVRSQSQLLLTSKSTAKSSIFVRKVTKIKKINCWFIVNFSNRTWWRWNNENLAQPRNQFLFQKKVTAIFFRTGFIFPCFLVLRIVRIKIAKATKGA